MATTNSCAMLMLAVVTAVSLNTAVSGQEVGRSGNRYTRVRHAQGTKASKQWKINANSTRFVVPSARALHGRGTKPIRQRRNNARSTRFVYPNQKVSSKRLVPMKVYKYQKQGRRVGLAELRRRVYALERRIQSQSSRTGDKPTPQNNRELAKICKQMEENMVLITSDMDYHLRRGGKITDHYFIELKLLYNRAARDYLRHGCGDKKYLILKPQMQVMEGQFKLLK